MNLFWNGSFEREWTDLPPFGGLTNQVPAGFNLFTALPGTRLASADAPISDDPPVYNTVIVVPECVHKFRSQLPDADELILQGDVVYKIFAASGPFSADLKSWVIAPAAGTLRIKVPVEVHQHGDGSPGAAIWRVIIDGEPSDWLTFGEFEDRAYTEYARSLTVSAGQVAAVTLQVESRAIGGIDFFTDEWRADFEPAEQPIEPECRGLPREQYERVYNVIPQDATPEEATRIFQIAWQRGKQTVGGSSDDAGIGDLDKKTAVEWNRIEPSQYIGFYEQFYPGTTVVFESLPEFGSPEPEPPPPEPEPWTPHNYVPKGTKLGFHGVGDGGQSGDIFGKLPADAHPPTAKIIVSLGAAADILNTGAKPQIVGRLIDHREWHNLEWFNYNGDPIAQAEDRMAKLMTLCDPYRACYDYWEIINEQAPPHPQDHAKLALFFLRAMEIAEAHGYRLALFSHSVGTPEPEAWDAIADTGVFERAAAGGHAISLHEYGDMDIDRGSCLLRYRDVYERIILPRHLDIPLYITEYNVWREQLPQNIDDAMLNWLFGQWARYDAEASRDPYVAGVHVYTVGEITDRYRDWIYRLYPRFREYAVAVKDLPNG